MYQTKRDLLGRVKERLEVLSYLMIHFAFIDPKKIRLASKMSARRRYGPVM